MKSSVLKQPGRDDAAQLLAALDTLRVALTIFDSRGRLVYANAHLNYLLRSLPPVTALIGCSYADLIRHEVGGGEIAPAALAGGTAAFIAAHLAQLEARNTSLDVPLADRRVIEIKARRGMDGLTVLLWADVTAARAHMARLEEAVSLSADAFAFFDPQDRLIMGNDLYARLCGFASVADLKGKSFGDIARIVAYSGRIVLDEAPQAWLERRLKGHNQPAGAVTLKLDSGECYLVRDRASQDGGRALVFTDITDKVRAETALAEQQHALATSMAEAEERSSYLADLAHRLDQANASVDSAKTTLLRTMGHELKTPLNAILGFSDLMQAMAERMTPAQVREYAGLIHQGGSNLLKMITQIMDLTKISAGRYDLRRGAVDAGSVLWLARESFEGRAQARGVTIDADQCPIGLMADADESVFTAMVHALIDNAVTFTRPQGKVILSVRPHEDGLHVAVRDDGEGVAPEDLARILEPFEHAGRGDGSQHAKGAGLGLTLVKAFAELHGGRLELDSAPGQGFTAALILPAA